MIVQLAELVHAPLLISLLMIGFRAQLPTFTVLRFISYLGKQDSTNAAVKQCVLALTLVLQCVLLYICLPGQTNF